MYVHGGFGWPDLLSTLHVFIGRILQEVYSSVRADRAAALQGQVKNVENPGVKSTPGAPPSLRSAHPINLLSIRDRINGAVKAIELAIVLNGEMIFVSWVDSAALRRVR